MAEWNANTKQCFAHRNRRRKRFEVRLKFQLYLIQEYLKTKCGIHAVIFLIIGRSVFILFSPKHALLLHIHHIPLLLNGFVSLPFLWRWSWLFRARFHTEDRNNARMDCSRRKKERNYKTEYGRALCRVLHSLPLN